MHVCNVYTFMLRGKVRIRTSIHHGSAVFCTERAAYQGLVRCGYYAVLTFTYLHYMKYVHLSLWNTCLS